MHRSHTALSCALAFIFLLGGVQASLHGAGQLAALQASALHDWAYSLALQAATWGAPLVTMYALRDHDALGPHAKASPNAIWRMEDISTPELAQEAGYVTPNVNVLYGFGFMDLRQEPIVLEVPDSKNLYYMVEVVDMWTNAFAYVGGKTTGYQGGKFLLVGPHNSQETPPDLQRIECPTPWILLQPRVHCYVDGKLALKRAQDVLNQIQVRGLSSYLEQQAPPSPQYAYPSPHPTHPKLPVSALSYQDPLQFWDLFMAALNENPPPPDQLLSLFPLFRPLGLEFGKPWDRSRLSEEVLSAMRESAEKIGDLLDHMPVGSHDHGAFIPPPSIGNFGTDYLVRAAIARVGLTANTPYESVYWIYTLDQQGSWLTGEKNYTLTFSKPIPFYEPGFWSITLYDATNNYTVPNPLHRYMLGSDTPLKKNPDGSITLYLQKESPGPEWASNWLPTPQGGFYLIPRSYAPTSELIQVLSDPHAWPVPTVVPRS